MKKSLKAHLIFIGSELLKGKSNTYPPLFCSELSLLGIEVIKETSLPDDINLIANEIKSAYKTADIILVTGGLGPTFDDITREAASKALGLKLIPSHKIFMEIKKRFEKYKRPMTENNISQVNILEGATAISNDFGTAPGQYLEITDGKRFKKQFIAFLPGPLIEWKPMFDKTVKPQLINFFAIKTKTQTMELKITDIGESAAEELLRPVIEKFKTASFTILSSPGNLRFQVSVRDGKIPKIKSECKKILGDKIYGTDGDTLEKVIGIKLKKAGLTLAIAESCTGGLISHKITEIPGSSKYFLGGVNAYSNKLKQKLLGVKTQTLKKYGAVSNQCASEMARGIAKVTGSDYSLAVTGVAGPSGGTKQKPVGTVFIAVSIKGKKTIVHQHYLSGNRSIVKLRAANAALNIIRLAL